ncbi:unnamed protein product [Schistosoma mattheei]|uniref:Uncharacterized protein n=1 Tax=Schistosoma mattheei TaxID=31246 RepID=A0AA85B636_9TREM|nr:unnamed protein product [Schistosoma mattheei]
MDMKQSISTQMESYLDKYNETKEIESPCQEVKQPNIINEVNDSTTIKCIHSSLQDELNLSFSIKINH